MNARKLGAIAAATLLTVPWLGSWLLGSAGGLSPGMTVAVAGIGILGASFLLTWGAETAEKDVPRAFAIAVLAVLAVAPEYAVDALYAWQAGVGGATAEACAQFTTEQMEAAASGTVASACHSANLAVANMTGANRILIGIGWAGVALFTVFRSGADADPAVTDRAGALRDAVSLDRDISLEVAFLFVATLWAFLVPLGGWLEAFDILLSGNVGPALSHLLEGGIDALDMVFLVGLYVLYILVVLRGEPEPEVEHTGVPALLGRIPHPRRALVVLSLFAFSGIIIFTGVEPFAHSLEQLGRDLGIPSFFMIQWIAPLASESPELIVVVVLVNKARSTAGFNALVSSKLNQWTLLIGTLVLVHSVAVGGYAPLHFDAKQAAEIWLTAAQSFFALALIINFEMSVREALALFALFISQVVIEFLSLQEILHLPGSETDLLHFFAVIYIVLGVGLLLARRDSVTRLLRETRGIVAHAVRGAPAGDVEDGEGERA